ncbi:3506_t:CDS:1, partial [Paraglomus occultum]
QPPAHSSTGYYISTKPSRPWSSKTFSSRPPAFPDRQPPSFSTSSIIISPQSLVSPEPRFRFDDRARLTDEQQKSAQEAKKRHNLI